MKIKTVHIITRLVPGGAQEIVEGIAMGLDKSKHEVFLLCGPEDLMSEERIQEIRNANVKVKIISELVRPLAPMKDVAALVKICAYLRKIKPHIVHTHTSKAGIIGRLAAFITRVPVIVHTPHGHIFKPLSEIEDVPHNQFWLNVLLCIERLISGITRKIITLTDIEKEESINFKLGKRDKFRTIHNAVDREKFKRTNINVKALREKYKLPESGFVIGSVGRLSRVKGHKYFIEAASLILKEDVNASFILAGDGPERRLLENLAYERGIKNRVHFLGYHKNVAEILQLLDLFVLPSVYEGFGISILEAFAMGIPVVATAVGGVPELIKDGVDGILVSPRNPEAIKTVVLELLNNKGNSHRLAEEGGKKILSDFGIEKMVKEHEEMYEGLLKDMESRSGGR